MGLRFQGQIFTSVVPLKMKMGEYMEREQDLAACSLHLMNVANWQGKQEEAWSGVLSPWDGDFRHFSFMFC